MAEDGPRYPGWSPDPIFLDDDCWPKVEEGHVEDKRALREQQRAHIRAENDRFRSSLVGGRVLVTQGVNAKGRPFVAAATAAIQAYSDFPPDNGYGDRTSARSRSQASRSIGRSIFTTRQGSPARKIRLTPR